MWRIVLDTSGLVAAFRSRNGASFRILELASAGELRPLISHALFLEYEAFLTRPALLQAAGLDHEIVVQALDDLATRVERVYVHFVWRPQLPDPDDELVFDAAVNGRATAIVTHNIADLVDAGRRFGIKVVTPGQFLRELMT